jgi:hypothetical protein
LWRTQSKDVPCGSILLNSRSRRIEQSRARSDQHKFIEWFLKLGNGTLKSPRPDLLPHAVSIPGDCVVVGKNESLVSLLFGQVTSREELASTVILAPTNEHTLRLNLEVLDILPGNARLYLSADRACCDSEEEEAMYPIEFLNSITPTGMPPHRLVLKEGSIIMLLRNLDIRKGLCNGTRLWVKRLYDCVIDAEVLSGANTGFRVLIPRIKLAPSDSNLPFTLERIQFPVRLARSITIKKSQGQTFKKSWPISEITSVLSWTVVCCLL